MNDTALHITNWGASGPTVILVHGGVQGVPYGGNRVFAAQERLAEHGWRVFVPDRPGHGKTPAPGRPDDAALDGVLIADLIGDDGAHLVGHSFGGCVVLAAAARRPSVVRSLTLIEPAMAPIAMGDSCVEAFVGKVRQVFTSAKSFSDVGIGFSKLVGVPDAIRGDAPPVEFERLGKGLVEAILPSESVLRDALAIVKNAGIPLLVVTGGWNPAFDAIGKAAAALGAGRHAVVATDHHFPQIVSDEFNTILGKFMTVANGRSSTTS